MTIPLLIDCDPGVDDAFALALALASPELELLAVSTVAGNVALDSSTANALALLEAFGRPDVPVAPGARRSLVRRSPGHPPIHGSGGLGSVALAPARRRPEERHAVEVLAGRLRCAAPRSVTIAGLGPLTNLALLFSLYPELSDRVARLVIMGGALGPGNVSTVAEFNVWADPEAAHLILAESELPVCVVGLEVTRRATLTSAQIQRLRDGGGRGELLARILPGYGDRGPDGGPPLHDALALAAIVDPAVIVTAPALVEVDTSTGLGRGQTFCAFDMPIAGWGGFSEGVVDQDIPPRVQVALDLDIERFRALLLERIAG